MSEVTHLEQMQTADNQLINRLESLQRLVNNSDFRNLILHDYIIVEASQCAETAGNPAMNAEQKADALEMSKAPGHLKRYLRVIELSAQQAINRREELQEAIVQARQEEDSI